MEELKRFQGSTFDTIARRKLTENQDTINELTTRIQKLQNEVNCLNDSRDFKDAESVRSGHSHVASQPVSFPPHPVPGGMLSRSLGMSSRKDGPPSIWETHGISGHVFANPAASSSAPYPQELNPWSSHISQSIHSSQAEKNENQTPVQNQRCQSGPSAKSSVIPSEGDSSKNYGADQQRLQMSDLHFDKFPTPATFACWKIRFKTEVCTCSQFLTKAMLWIREVELVDSVDDLKSSSSIRGRTIERENPLFAVTHVTSVTDLLYATHQIHDNWQLGCVFQDMKPPKSILRKSTNMQRPIQRVKFTKAIARHTKIRDQNPSLGLICLMNLISVDPSLQNLRIGPRRRQSDKSDRPAKQRGSWPKVRSK